MGVFTGTNGAFTVGTGRTDCVERETCGLRQSEDPEDPWDEEGRVRGNKSRRSRRNPGRTNLKGVFVWDVVPKLPFVHKVLHSLIRPLLFQGLSRNCSSRAVTPTHPERGRSLTDSLVYLEWVLSRVSPLRLPNRQPTGVVVEDPFRPNTDEGTPVSSRGPSFPSPVGPAPLRLGSSFPLLTPPTRGRDECKWESSPSG